MYGAQYGVQYGAQYDAQHCARYGAQLDVQHGVRYGAQYSAQYGSQYGYGDHPTCGAHWIQNAVVSLSLVLGPSYKCVCDPFIGNIV